MHNKDNDPYARKNFRNDETICKSRLLKNKKEKLKGVGDLSLLSICDIGSQFHNQTTSTLIAITFDRTLQKVLRDHSGFIVQSQQFIGEKDNENSIEEKMTDFIDRSQKMENINLKSQDFFSNFITDLQETSWLSETLKNKV